MKRTVSIISTLIFILFSAVSVSSCQKEDKPEEQKIEDYDATKAGLDFTEFSLSDGTATYNAWSITKKGILVSIPYGSDMTKLTATFAHNGNKVTVKNVEQESGKDVHDFSDFMHPVTYRVSAITGTSWDYPVVIFTLPVLEISVQGQAEIRDKVNWKPSTLRIHQPDGTCSQAMKMSMKGRGNATWSAYPKKPYAIKMDERTEMFGMPEHKRWVMLAMYRGFIGNPMEAEMERRTESIEWCPSGVFVELVLNGAHQGVYYFCEQIRLDKNRINIKELDPTDTDPQKITGGYLLEYDNLYDEQYKFRSEFFKDVEGNDLPIMLKNPDTDVPDCQFNYIKNYIHDFEAALSDDRKLATREYAEYVDIDTFIDCWFVWETVGNYEAFKPRSVFMYKGRDGKDSPEGTVCKLKCGPLWDQEIFHVNMEFPNKDCYYFTQFFKDPVFVRRLKEKWPVYLSNLKGNEQFPVSIYDYLYDMSEKIYYPVERDMKMWNNEYFTLYDDVDRVRRKLPAKLVWMDQQIKALPE